MKKVVLKSFLVLVFIFCAIPFSNTKANLVINGSFEYATIDPGNGYPGLFTGSTAITDWTVIGSNIEYIGTYWTASEGSRSIDLNGNSPGGVEQAISTIIGESYLVTFDIAGNPDGAPATKTMNVSAIGSTTQIQLFSFDKTGYSRSNMGWETMNWTFIADDTTTTLQFISTVSGAYGPALDNVSVSTIPVPGAIILGSIGAGFVGWLRRKKAI